MGIPEALLAAGLPPLARAAWVEVSLDAIANNVRSLKARLPEGGHLDVVRTRLDLQMTCSSKLGTEH
jgi:hypothetical protein